MAIGGGELVVGMWLTSQMVGTTLLKYQFHAYVWN